MNADAIKVCRLLVDLQRKRREGPEQPGEDAHRAHHYDLLRMESEAHKLAERVVAAQEESKC